MDNKTKKRVSPLVPILLVRLKKSQKPEIWIRRIRRADGREDELESYVALARTQWQLAAIGHSGWQRAVNRAKGRRGCKHVGQTSCRKELGRPLQTGQVNMSTVHGTGTSLHLSLSLFRCLLVDRTVHFPMNAPLMNPLEASPRIRPATPGLFTAGHDHACEPRLPPSLAPLRMKTPLTPTEIDVTLQDCRSAMQPCRIRAQIQRIRALKIPHALRRYSTLANMTLTLAYRSRSRCSNAQPQYLGFTYWKGYHRRLLLFLLQPPDP